MGEIDFNHHRALLVLLLMLDAGGRFTYKGADLGFELCPHLFWHAPAWPGSRPAWSWMAGGDASPYMAGSALAPRRPLEGP